MYSLLIAFAWAATPVGAHETPFANPAGLAEASMGFDQDSVEPFLLKLAGMLDRGFTGAEARQLASQIASIPVDTSRSWTYSVSYLGRPTPLVIGAYQDDYEAPNLHFYSSESVTSSISHALETFSEEQGW
jgi:hypothetical protein